MAQNTIIKLAAQTWTQLTDADVSAITFQNLSDGDVWVVVQTDATTPTGSPQTNDALRYGQGQGERNVALADLAPGLTSPDRVFAWSRNGAGVFVSHA